MYHCKDGLFFERLPFGDVHLVKTGDGKQPDANYTNVLFETTIQRSLIASIMAYACDRGYTAHTFYEAYGFLKHTESEADPQLHMSFEAPHGDK